jgi:hypothetical protein
MPRDLSPGPLLDKEETMNLVDLIRCEHRMNLYTGDAAAKPGRCSFQDPGGAARTEAMG